MQLHAFQEKDEAVNSAELANLPTITAEIAAARRDLLIAARNTAASAVAAVSAAPPPALETSSVHGSVQSKRKDAHSNSWLLAPLECSAVRNRDLAHSSEKQLAECDSFVKASLTRLDGRLRSLENQGVRSDRRSAELAGLAQALTEEQRALLIRMDRLEEQTRSGGLYRPSRDSLQVADNSNFSGEAVIQRLERVEQDQRMASTNFKLIVSLLDETEQRHQQKVRSLEDLWESRLEQFEAAAKTVPNVAPGVLSNRPAFTEVDKENCGYDETFCNSIAGMDYKTAKSLKTAQDLLARCETSAATHPECKRENQDNLDPRWGAQRLEAHSDAIKDLQARVGDLLRASDAKAHALDQHSLSLDELRRNLTAYPTREEVGRTHEEHDKRLAMLFAKLELLPTHEQLAITHKDAEAAQSQIISNLQTQIEYLQGTHSSCYKKMGERLQSYETGMEPLRSMLDAFQERQVEFERRLESHQMQNLTDEVRGLSAKFLSAPSAQQLIDLQAIVDSLRARLEVLGSEVRTVGATCSDAVAHLQSQMQGGYKTSECQHVPSDIFTHRQTCDSTQAESLEFRASEEKKVISERMETLLASVIPDLQSKVQDLQHTHCSCYKKVGESLDSHEVSIKLLLSRLDNLYERQSEAEMQRLQCIHDGHTSVRRGIHEHSNETLSMATKPQLAPTSQQLTAIQETVDSQRARLEVLASEVRIVGSSCADAVAQLQQHVQRKLDEAIESSVEEEHVDGITFNAELQPELASEVRGVRSDLTALHEKVEEELKLRSMQVEQQVPEALRRIEHLANDCVMCATKVEEHEVRLGLALTRQLANEEKIHACMNRIEQQPGVAKFRSICQEELDARHTVADYADLEKRLDLTMDAVAELGERMHSQDVLVMGSHVIDGTAADETVLHFSNS